MPSTRSTRNLTLVAKTLQTLANFTRFQGKEYFMEFLNSFVEEEAPRMKQFLSDISCLQAGVNSEKEGTLDWSQHIDQGKHLAILHHLLVETLAKLSKDTREELSPLGNILESLSSVTQSEKKLSVAEGLDEHENSLISTNKLNTPYVFDQQTFEIDQQSHENSMLLNKMKLTLDNSYDSLHCVHSPTEKHQADNYQVKTSEILEREQQEKKQTHMFLIQNKRASTLPRKMNGHWAKRGELMQYNSYSGHKNDTITSDKQHVKNGLSLNDSLNRKIKSSPLISPSNIIENNVGCADLFMDIATKSQTIVEKESNPSNMPMCLEDLQDLLNYADEQHVLKNSHGPSAHDINSKHGAWNKASSENIPFNFFFSECCALQRRIPSELEFNDEQLTRSFSNVRQFLTSTYTLNDPKCNAKNNDSSKVFKDSYRGDKIYEEPANILHTDMFNEKRKELQFFPGARVDKYVDVNEIRKNQENGRNTNFSKGINDFRVEDNRLNSTYDVTLAEIGTISVTNIEPSGSRYMFEQAIYSNGNRRSDIPRTNPMMQHKYSACCSEMQNNNSNYDKNEYVRRISHDSERLMSEYVSDSEYPYNSSLGTYQYIQCPSHSDNRNNNSFGIEKHTISNHMKLNNIESVEQCQREIQRLQAELDAMRQKLETSDFKQELRTDLTNITNCNNSMVGGIIGRLLAMEEELRREQQTMYLALSQKQRVIKAQVQQIAALDAANNRLLTALSSMQKKCRTDCP
ncbi:uncharacterized protein LOC118467384 [Anopheles albimanus]|nr:uncharacterized protein LOC118467384 [Anopheles albimanus]